MVCAALPAHCHLPRTASLRWRLAGGSAEQWAVSRDLGGNVPPAKPLVHRSQSVSVGARRPGSVRWARGPRRAGLDQPESVPRRRRWIATRVHGGRSAGPHRPVGDGGGHLAGAAGPVRAPPLNRAVLRHPIVRQLPRRTTARGTRRGGDGPAYRDGKAPAALWRHCVRRHSVRAGGGSRVRGWGSCWRRSALRPAECPFCDPLSSALWTNRGRWDRSPRPGRHRLRAREPVAAPDAGRELVGAPGAAVLLDRPRRCSHYVLARRRGSRSPPAEGECHLYPAGSQRACDASNWWGIPGARLHPGARHREPHAPILADP